MVQIKRYADKRLACNALAGEFVTLANEAVERRDGTFTVGLSTGSSPTDFYRRLVEIYRSGDLMAVERIITFNLDEYWPIDPNDPGSYTRYMHESLFRHIPIPPRHIHIPDGSTPRERVTEVCAAYESAIDEAGGLDLIILGVGRNGHIGFNEPTTDEALRRSRTRLVRLADSTLADNARFFPRGVAMPQHAISMGVRTILEAKRLRLLAFGTAKADAIGRLARGECGPRFPVGYVGAHPDAHIFVDEGAARDLPDQGEF